MLPDAPIVHPGIGGYPCADLCAAAVAYKLAQALLAGAGEDPRMADEDLDLVALATVADVVPLQGENRRLVRAGLRALASTRKPGLRALMDVARVDPSTIDASAIGFRLGPRLNAAGRLYRADAGLELLLTEDRERARAVAEELDAVNSERRDVETRIRFEAEAQVAEQGAAAAYVLASESWHPGVIGIVAARIAERHHRPAVLIALEGEEGTGSGRSIPGFDLLGGLHASSAKLSRYGGHRAAAGLTIARADVPAFREAFAAHAASVLTPEDLRPEVRVDAVAPGDTLTLGLAEELERLAPFGQANPPVSLLVPERAARRPAADGRGPPRLLHARRGRRPLALRPVRRRLAAARRARRARGRRRAPGGQPLERDDRAAAGAPPRPSRRAGADRGGRRAGVPPRAGSASWTASSDAAATPPPSRREVVDRRGTGIAGLVADLVAAGEPVLVVGAHAPHRARQLRDRVGGFSICCWHALADDPALAEGFAHVVALDPPAGPLLDYPSGEGWTHLAWGAPELGFATRIHHWDFALRDPLAATYRALRASRGGEGEACEAALRGEGPQPRSAALAGRLVRVLTELDLVVLDREGPALTVSERPERTALERSAAYRAYQQRLEDGLRYLTSSPIAIAA